MNPRGLVLAYEETYVLPVASDMDGFCFGSKGMKIESVPSEQVIALHSSVAIHESYSSTVEPQEDALPWAQIRCTKHKRYCATLDNKLYPALRAVEVRSALYCRICASRCRFKIRRSDADKNFNDNTRPKHDRTKKQSKFWSARTKSCTLATKEKNAFSVHE